MNMTASLSYGLQQQKNLLGTVLAPVTLTNSYAGNSAILRTSGCAMLTFYVQYTAQTSNNSIQIKIEGSPDDPNPTTPQGVPVVSTFYQDISTSVAAGTATATQVEYTFVNPGTSALGIRLAFPAADHQIKISIKETIGAGSAGTASVRVLMGPNN